MPLYTARFRSVKIDLVKTLQPKAGPVVKEKPQMLFDADTAMRHELALCAADFLVPSAWLMGFFFSLVAIGFSMTVLYGFLVLGQALDLGRRPLGGGEIAFVACALVLFASAWAGFTVFSVIKRAKKDLVERERGKGAWKLIDEARWEHFTTMLRLARERAEREKAKAAAERDAG